MNSPDDASSSRPSNFSIRPSLDVSAGLIFHKGKLLITQRRAKDHLGGLWEFPGGKREGGESDEACLRRELREELGIEVEVKELLESIRHDYPEKSVSLKFFRCSLIRGEPSPIGCDAMAWVSPAQLADYAFPEADLRLLGKLRASPHLWAE